MDISGIKSEHIPLIWPEVQPFIESALFYTEGEYHISDIYNLLMYQKMQLWTASLNDGLHGCAVTEILQFPQKLVGSVVLASGHSFDTWKDMANVIEDWAYEQGCDSVRNLGRLGWQRRAKEHGYYPRCIIYTKRLRVNNEDSH